MVNFYVSHLLLVYPYIPKGGVLSALFCWIMISDIVKERRGWICKLFLHLVWCLLYLHGILMLVQLPHQTDAAKISLFLLALILHAPFGEKNLCTFCASQQLIVKNSSRLLTGHSNILQCSNHKLWRLHTLTNLSCSGSCWFFIFNSFFACESLEDAKIYPSLILLEWHTRNLSPQVW